MLVGGFRVQGCGKTIFRTSSSSHASMSGLNGELNMSKKKIKIKWLKEPEKHAYPAAQSYLSLIYDEPITTGYVEKLRHAPISEFAAKDIFRSSGLSLLGISNGHV